MSTPKHFLDIDQISAEALQHMLRVAEQSRQNGRKPDGGKTLAGKTLAMIFEKPSTRTRVSFEIGMRQLGGEVVVLQSNDLQLGRGETVADTARVLSRYVDALMIRTDAPDKLTEIAEHASVPVINGLTDRSHPCQVLADIVTYQQHRGPIKGRRVAWSGDGNNVAVSWIHAAQRFQFELVLACPPAYAPLDSEVNWACQSGAKVSVVTDPHAAVRDADCVVTDTWVSMSDKDEAARRRTLPPYQVNQQLMALAKSDSLFMHCLPAHRGEEVTDEVIDGPHSVVWDEAENRVHAQKAILDWCLGE